MILRTLILIVGLFLVQADTARSHALEPGYLDLAQISDSAWKVFWRKPDVQGKPMAIGVMLPETCTPNRDPEPSHDGSAWVSAWVADCPQGLAGLELSIPGLTAQRTDVLVRVQALDGGSQTMRLTPDNPGFLLAEDPTMFGVLASYVGLGFEHILEGWDHLLFVFALLLLISDTWRLIGAITAFTVAHSITLALAALGQISVPSPPVEAIIALSIIFLAVEILKHRGGSPRLSQQYPWIVSFSFGLLHGLGFAGALSEIGLPQGDVPMALLGFNLGVEFGQIAFVLAVLLVREVAVRLLRLVSDSPDRLLKATMPVTAYAIGGVATFWFAERLSGF